MIDYSKPVLIGYEGNRHDALCSWGSAAIRIGDRLYNSNMPGNGQKIDEMGPREWASIQKIKETQIPEGVEWKELYVFDMPLHAFDRPAYKWFEFVVPIQIKDVDSQRGCRVFINHKIMVDYLVHMHNYHLMEKD